MPGAPEISVRRSPINQLFYHSHLGRENRSWHYSSTSKILIYLCINVLLIQGNSFNHPYVVDVGFFVKLRVCSIGKECLQNIFFLLPWTMGCLSNCIKWR